VVPSFGFPETPKSLIFIARVTLPELPPLELEEAPPPLDDEDPPDPADELELVDDREEELLVQLVVDQQRPFPSNEVHERIPPCASHAPLLAADVPSLQIIPPVHLLQLPPGHTQATSHPATELEELVDDVDEEDDTLLEVDELLLELAEVDEALLETDELKLDDELLLELEEELFAVIVKVKF